MPAPASGANGNRLRRANGRRSDRHGRVSRGGRCGGILPFAKGSPHKPGDPLAGAPMRKAPECRPQPDLQLRGPGAAIGNSTCSGRRLRCSLDSDGVPRARAVI